MPIVPRITRSQPNEELEGFLLEDSSDASSIRDVIENVSDPGTPESHYQVTFQPGDYSGVSGVDVPDWVNVVILPGADFASGAFIGATDNVVDLNRLAGGVFELGDNLTVPGKLTVENGTASGLTSVFEQDLLVEGDLTVDGSITTTDLTEVSTITLKDNVSDMPPVLSRVMKLRPVLFEWEESGDEDFGLIAEEVADVFPEAVSSDEDGNPKGVKYSKLSAILIRAIQEITTR
jgi:hypothetical protein